MTRHAAIVVAGGLSRRMGRPKALLEFGSETLLQRIVSRLSEVTTTQIVVASDAYELPELPSGTIITYDEVPARGPLEGIRAGLKAGQNLADDFYVTGCDGPRLQPDFVRHLQSRREDHDIVIARDEDHFHPLNAIYHRRVLPMVEELLAADRLRPFFLLEAANTLIISTEELRAADPELYTLDNLNTLADYHHALAEEFPPG